MKRSSILALISLLAVAPRAYAVEVAVTLHPDGTFEPSPLVIQHGDTVVWTLPDPMQSLDPLDPTYDHGRNRGHAIARIAPIGLDPSTGVVLVDGSGVPLVDADDACFQDSLDLDAGEHLAPACVNDPTCANPHAAPFDGADANEFTGPTRHGVSGIWALGPEGGEVSQIEIPSTEATEIAGGFGSGCVSLVNPALSVDIDDYWGTPDVDAGTLVYGYSAAEWESGADAHPVPSSVTNLQTGTPHQLCRGWTRFCVGTDCVEVEPDPAHPESIPPGTYFGGLLTSTYENPDVTGVVLRLNWKDLQYDDDGVIRERWEHLDREIERAILHGKHVTLDVRAGMFGTPEWIFDDYAPAWCTTTPCAFSASSHPSAGFVAPYTFTEYYTKPDSGCGEVFRIGSPGDPNYVALYQDFIAKLAEHVAQDARRFQAVAHVKVSGANLRTSEAELPHSCDDDYTNTADHQPLAFEGQAQLPALDAQWNPGGDRVLDVYKTKYTDLAANATSYRTEQCECAPETWYEHAGYVPEHIYDYYAAIENQIVLSFFGRKSLGYQLIQDGFPRARAEADGGFLGDHLYRESLAVSASIPAVVNWAYETLDACASPSIGSDTLPMVFENRPAGAHEYCSSDTVAGSSLFLSLKPLFPHPSAANLARNAQKNTNGTRYPAPYDQTETVLQHARWGLFSDPSLPATDPARIDEALGKLFVPQHSGLTPLPQERDAIGYDTARSACAQEVGRLDATYTANFLTSWTPFVGTYIAAFPVDGTATVSGVASGCPNPWIVVEGLHEESEMPDGTIGEHTAPQLTGFQTMNDVRSPDHVESSLFNLVYNSNAVFLELYESAIWQIDRTRGTGALAEPLDDGVDDVSVPERLESCDPLTDFWCYSKNLSQWSEELHLRRADLAADNATVAAYADPFPMEHRHTFENTTGAEVVYAMIDPSFCVPGEVDTPTNADGRSALGVIVVEPQ